LKINSNGFILRFWGWVVGLFFAIPHRKVFHSLSTIWALFLYTFLSLSLIRRVARGQGVQRWPGVRESTAWPGVRESRAHDFGVARGQGVQSFSRVAGQGSGSPA